MQTTITYIIYIHGFQGDRSSFQSFPTDVHNTLTGRHGTRPNVLPPNMTLKSIIYPTYKSRKSIHLATASFLQWMYTLPPGLIILVAHSMGGLLAADAAYAASSFKQSETRIIGVLACDVPYLGMHPHVVLSGIVSLLPKRKKRVEYETKRVKPDRSIPVHPGISPPRSVPSSPPPSYNEYQTSTFRNEKEINDERIVDIMVESSISTDKDGDSSTFIEMARRGKNDGKMKYMSLQPLELPSTPSDQDSSLTTQQQQQQQQPVFLVPPALPPRPSSCPPNTDTTAVLNKSASPSPRQLYPPPPSHPYVYLRSKSQSNITSISEPSAPDESATLLSRILHVLHLERNTTASNVLAGSTSFHLDLKILENTEKAKQRAVECYDSVIETMEFGSSMFDPRGLLERYRLLTEWKGHWFAFWTVAIRRDQDKKQEIDARSTVASTTSVVPHDLPSSNRVESHHHFVVIPREKDRWERIIIHGARDEVEAHIGLFRRDLNWEYDAFVIRTADILSQWITQGI